MHCPKCKGYMKPIQYKGIEVDRCTKCYGLWFDKFELTDLKKLAGSEVIDIGDVELGEDHDNLMEIKCPKCFEPMSLTRDPRQTHITYEKCAKCGGVYFDSGEFKDLKKMTFGEFFRYLFKKKEINPLDPQDS